MPFGLLSRTSRKKQKGAWVHTIELDGCGVERVLGHWDEDAVLVIADDGVQQIAHRRRSAVRQKDILRRHQHSHSCLSSTHHEEVITSTAITVWLATLSTSFNHY